MRRPNSRPLLLSAGVLALGSCSADRSAGNSVETENTVGARMMSVDSLLGSWNQPAGQPTVATIRLDASNFDFSRSTAAGNDLRLADSAGRPVPFHIAVWDSALKQGRIQAHIDSVLRRKGAKLVLSWGERLRPALSDSVATWSGISDSVQQLVTSVLVDDFEGGNLNTRLPGPGLGWYTAASDTVAKVSKDSLKPAGMGRSGKAMMMAYTAIAPRYSLTGTAVAVQAVSLRSMDSLVLWVRGSGNLSIAFDHLTNGTGPKAWISQEIDSNWTRLRIRPQDLNPPVAGSSYNVGWVGVRDSVTHLTFLINGGSQLWLDDIRMYGVNRGDFVAR